MAEVQPVGPGLGKHHLSLWSLRESGSDGQMAVCLQKTDLKAKALTFGEEANEAASSPELQARVKWEGSREGGMFWGLGRALRVGEGSREEGGLSGWGRALGKGADSREWGGLSRRRRVLGKGEGSREGGGLSEMGRALGIGKESQDEGALWMGRGAGASVRFLKEGNCLTPLMEEEVPSTGLGLLSPSPYP